MKSKKSILLLYVAFIFHCILPYYSIGHTTLSFSCQRIRNHPIKNIEMFKEGPEKMEFAYFWLGKWDFMRWDWDSSAIKKENGNGIKFEQKSQPVTRWDLCSGTLGFSWNLGWEMGIGTPLSGPSLNEVLTIQMEFLMRNTYSTIFQ